jgi:hypothetical protein
MFDRSTFAQAFSAPGIDPRQWISYGVVTRDHETSDVVTYDDEIGAPIVTVLLQPSEVFVACRVAQSVAGNGEAEWFPFVEGDEVVVAIPAGNEKSGCIILGRLNNQLDAFPSSVAGSGSQLNNFAFKRMRAPFIMETSETLLFRSAKTEAFLSLSALGAWTMSNEKGFVAVANDFITMQTADNEQLVQINLNSKLVAIESGPALLHLKSSGASQFFVPGTLQIGTSGTAPTAFHGVTAESVAVAMQALMQAIGSVFPSMIIGSALAASAIPIMQAALLLTSTLPVTPLTPAIQANLTIPPDTSGVLPRFGVAGLLLS